MSAPASQRLVDLFDFLRATGTELPLTNSQLCTLLSDALFNLVAGDSILCANLEDDDFDLMEPQVATCIDNLVADLEVIVEEVQFREQEA